MRKSVFVLAAIIVLGLGIVIALPLLSSGSPSGTLLRCGVTADTTDTAYEEPPSTLTFTEGSGEAVFDVDPSWEGISLQASYSSPCEGKIDLISPSGIIVTTFEFSLTVEEISEGLAETGSVQYVDLQPGIWPGEIYGQWTFKHFLQGGPVDIVINKIASPVAFSP